MLLCHLCLQHGYHSQGAGIPTESAEVLSTARRIEIITPISPHPVLGQEMVSKWGQRLLRLLYTCVYLSEGMWLASDLRRKMQESELEAVGENNQTQC